MILHIFIFFLGCPTHAGPTAGQLRWRAGQAIRPFASHAAPPLCQGTYSIQRNKQVKGQFRQILEWMESDN
jgi:hypothetical protein